MAAGCRQQGRLTSAPLAAWAVASTPSSREGRVGTTSLTTGGNRLAPAATASHSWSSNLLRFHTGMIRNCPKEESIREQP